MTQNGQILLLFVVVPAALFLAAILFLLWKEKHAAAKSESRWTPVWKYLALFLAQALILALVFVGFQDRLRLKDEGLLPRFLLIMGGILTAYTLCALIDSAVMAAWQIRALSMMGLFELMSLGLFGFGLAEGEALCEVFGLVFGLFLIWCHVKIVRDQILMRRAPLKEAVVTRVERKSGETQSEVYFALDGQEHSVPTALLIPKSAVGRTIRVRNCEALKKVEADPDSLAELIKEPESRKRMQAAEDARKAAEDALFEEYDGGKKGGGNP